MFYRTRSPEDTEAFGRALAGLLRGGDTLLLEGGLGAGKTCLTRGIAAGLAVLEPVASPTFVLLMAHEAGPGGLKLAHFDAYRLHSAEEWFELGFDEHPTGDEVAVIEWPSRVREALPPEAYCLEMTTENDERCFRFLGNVPQGAERCLAPWAVVEEAGKC